MLVQAFIARLLVVALALPRHLPQPHLSLRPPGSNHSPLCSSMSFATFEVCRWQPGGGAGPVEVPPLLTWETQHSTYRESELLRGTKAHGMGQNKWGTGYNVVSHDSCGEHAVVWKKWVIKVIWEAQRGTHSQRLRRNVRTMRQMQWVRRM